MPGPSTTHRLDVPGAQLHYEVRGSGPLFLVFGQPMTSGPFAPLADLLAADYTVVTYDPHGLGQSSVEDPSLPVTPEVQADDLALLVDAMGQGPAYAFGSSGGAVSGLALAARHPDKVRALVAHEPPVTQLLPDAPHVSAVVDGIEEAYRTHGAGAAWGAFVSLVMHQGPITAEGVRPASWPPPGDADADQVPPEPSEKQRADDELFFLRMLKPFTHYEPEVDRLRAGPARVVVGVGEASHGEVAVRSAVALAERLDLETTTFPGDHGGFMADPAGFASVLRRLLT